MQRFRHLFYPWLGACQSTHTTPALACVFLRPVSKNGLEQVKQVIISNFLQSRKFSIEKEVKVSVTKFRPHWDPKQSTLRKWSTDSIPVKLDLNSRLRKPCRFQPWNQKAHGLRDYFPPEKAQGSLLLVGIPFPFGYIDLLLKDVNGG